MPNFIVNGLYPFKRAGMRKCLHLKLDEFKKKDVKMKPIMFLFDDASELFELTFHIMIIWDWL